ncbi:MAG: NERD domain-containing protein, partial [Clostridia bacterium]|nr:NERD domain-containing protein [Clostridia bacterium]
ELLIKEEQEMWFFVILAVIGLAVLAVVIFTSISDERKRYNGRQTGKTYAVRNQRRRYYRKYTAEEKGNYGESLVANELRSIADADFAMLNDIIVVTDGKSHQIDHVAINRYGVFVIETNNYAGKIYGSAGAQKWRVYYDNGEQCEFYNPVQQNLTHCNSVKNIIGNVPIYSVIVFVKNNIIKTDAANVIPLSQLKYFISQPRGTEMTKEQMTACMEKLRANQQSNAVSADEHVSSIKETLDKANSGICPWCSQPLVEKQGKYGTFMACSNYPRCKFTSRSTGGNDRKAV